jgi:hypothetical protein
VAKEDRNGQEAARFYCEARLQIVGADNRGVINSSKGGGFDPLPNDSEKGRC